MAAGGGGGLEDGGTERERWNRGHGGARAAGVESGGGGGAGAAGVESGEGRGGGVMGRGSTRVDLVARERGSKGIWRGRGR